MTSAAATDPTEEPINDSVIETANERLDDGVNRCPQCGSTEIQLRVSTSKLICLFCRHEWSEAAIEPTVQGEASLNDLTGTVIASGASDITEETGLVTLKCSGCGADVVVNTAEVTSARCHWCRHVLTINQQVPNGSVPDAVLPFSITRDQAVADIKKFAGSRTFFAHRRFVKEFTPDNVVGVYMPYMVVDAKATGEVFGKAEIETGSYTRGSDNDEYTVYDADVYEISRTIDFTVDDLTLESSANRADLDVTKNTNNIINTIQPFDTKNAVAWNASYLTGYTSERRDQDVATMTPALENQLLSVTRAKVSNSTTQYDRGVRWESERITVHGTRWVSMYLPVWLYSYHHQVGGRSMVHYIAVNGRTGETMGSVPVSHGRLLLAALATGTVLEALAILIVGAL